MGKLASYAAGDTPAFDPAFSLPVIVDRSLCRHRTVWLAAGTSIAAYPIDLDALVRVSDAT